MLQEIAPGATMTANIYMNFLEFHGHFISSETPALDKACLFEFIS
jgi:hypothetical protein